jgi:hypothetical protein
MISVATESVMVAINSLIFPGYKQPFSDTLPFRLDLLGPAEVDDAIFRTFIQGSG